MPLISISRRTFIAGVAGLALASEIRPHAFAQNDPYPLVVDLDWLAQRALRADMRVIDVSPLHVWRDGHIDSAEHGWWRDTVDPNYPVYGAVLTQGDEESHRQQVLDSLELFTGDDVVVYDNDDGFRAARLVWFLRFIGFEHAALLRDGYSAWKANPFSIASASSTSTSPVVDPQQGFYLVTEQLVSRLDRSDVQIVDIRTDDERANDLDGNMPIGQIPGSIRLPWDSLLDEEGRLRSATDVRTLAANTGLDPTLETVLYGSFGVDTALSWLAFTDAGFAKVLTYDRGWAEWSTASDLPREPLS
jgi:thiosulfate/3-mercaptopyruvate sulfurtransferase